MPNSDGEVATRGSTAAPAARWPVRILSPEPGAWCGQVVQAHGVLHGLGADRAAAVGLAASIGDRPLPLTWQELPPGPDGTATAAWHAGPSPALPPGRHRFCIADASGEPLATRECRVGRAADQPPLFLGEIDIPGEDDEVTGPVLEIGGWVLLDGHAPSRVTAELSTGGSFLARTHLRRRDVAQAHPAIPDAEHSGFHIRAPIACAPEQLRSITIRLRAFSRSGDVWHFPARSLRMLGPTTDPAETATQRRMQLDAAAALPDMQVGPLPGTPDPGHILVFTHSLALGGAQLWLHELLRGLISELGWRVTIVSPIDGELHAECLRMGARVHLCAPHPVTEATRYESHVHELSLLAQASGAGAALVNTLGGFPAVDACQRIGLPAAWAIHESFTLPDFAFLNWGNDGLSSAVEQRWRHALAHCPEMLFVAEATRRMFRPHRVSGHSRTVRYGSDWHRFAGRVSRSRRQRARRSLGIADDAELVLNVGVAEARKGQAPLISGFDRVASAHQNAVLAVIGLHPNDYSSGLTGLAEKAHARERILLRDTEPHPLAWFEAADLFINSSDVESAPRSIVEAICCGIPVAASDVYGARELISEPESGWLFEPNDENAIAAVLDRALGTRRGDRGLRAAAAYRSALPWLDPAQYRDEFADIFRSLTGQTRPCPDTPVSGGGR